MPLRYPLWYNFFFREILTEPQNISTPYFIEIHTAFLFLSFIIIGIKWSTYESHAEIWAPWDAQWLDEFLGIMSEWVSELAITRASRNVWYTWSTVCDPQSKYSTPPYSLSSLMHFQSNTWQTWFYPHKQLTCLVSHTHYMNSFSTLTN